MILSIASTQPLTAGDLVVIEPGDLVGTVTSVDLGVVCVELACAPAMVRLAGLETVRRHP